MLYILYIKWCVGGDRGASAACDPQTYFITHYPFKHCIYTTGHVDTLVFKGESHSILCSCYYSETQRVFLLDMTDSKTVTGKQFKYFTKHLLLRLQDHLSLKQRSEQLKIYNIEDLERNSHRNEI